MPRTSARSVAILLPLVVALAAAIVVLFVVRWAQHEVAFARTRANMLEAATRIQNEDGDTAVLAALSRAQRDLATFVQPSIVHVEVAPQRRGSRGFTPGATGSGWVWDEAGHIVTAWHVVAEADRITIQLRDGHEYPARLIASDPATDIAVLKADARRIIPATMASQANVQPGDLVFAFGSPLDFRFSVTSGVVSGLGRDVSGQGPLGRLGYEDFIQVDAPINPGSSGGPITDHRGHIVGMSTAIAADPQQAAGSEQFSGVALAIPSHTIDVVVPQLIEDGAVARGFLGITVLDRDSPLGAWRSLRRTRGGVLVASVVEHSATHQMGVCPGDIIQIIEDRDGDPNSLPDATIEVRVPARDDVFEIEGRALSEDTVLLSPDRQLRDYLDAQRAPPGGVWIDSLVDGGAAESQGLLPGDLILSIGDRPLQRVSQLRSTVASYSPGETVMIRWWRPACTGPAKIMERQITLGHQQGRPS